MNEHRTRHDLADVCAAFLKLGCTSFGGPVAHLGYFHADLVNKRRWITDQAYADLVALCQFLPGPASSQLVFALGMHRAGLAGAIAASFCFLLPSAVLMIALGAGISAFGSIEGAGWVHGLMLAAVAVVAQAVWVMWEKLCPDRSRRTISLAAAAALLILPGTWPQIAIIIAGALVGYVLFRRTPAPPSDDHASARGHKAAVAALLTFGVLLFAPALIAGATGSRDIAVFDGFYRSGALVFGGGHVVLPLLRAEVVPPGWISDDAFLAGYGAAQAVPGPLFSFSGYLGAIIYKGPTAWLGGLWCLLAIFLPGWLLIAGALPFWHQLRSRSWAQAGLRGASAAVVGVLLAALYTPVCTEGIRDARDVVAAILAFLLLHIWRVPPVLVVALCAAAGQWLIG